MVMGGTVASRPSLVDALIVGAIGGLAVYYIFRPEIPVVSAVLDSAQDNVLRPLDFTGDALTFAVRGLRNNNPGNIRWNPANKWIGQLRDDGGGYIVFDTMENGLRALARLLTNYMRSGNNTVSKIITRWAPAADNNNTAAYIRAVVRDTGFAADQPLTATQGTIVPLMKAITRHENGFNPLTAQQFEDAYNAA